MLKVIAVIILVMDKVEATMEVTGWGCKIAVTLAGSANAVALATVATVAVPFVAGAVVGVAAVYACTSMTEPTAKKRA